VAVTDSALGAASIVPEPVAESRPNRVHHHGVIAVVAAQLRPYAGADDPGDERDPKAFGNAGYEGW
jgi:hypothetical protein